jgi:hypothetical protein
LALLAHSKGESEAKIFRIGLWWHQFRKKMIQHRLRWFGRPLEVPDRSGVLERLDNVKRGSGRPKLTWDELVKRDLKERNFSKELAIGVFGE